MDKNHIHLPPPALAGLTLNRADLAQRISELMSGRNKFSDKFASVTPVHERPGQVPDSLRPHEHKTVEIDFGHSGPHGVVEASVQQLRFVHRRLAAVADRQSALEPILTEFLKTLDDLIPARLPSRKIDGRAIERNRDTCSLPAFPRKHGTRRVCGRQLRLRARHSWRILALGST
jgi:hypothetical protein